MSEGWYYLHTNGDLIYKKFWPGEDNSTFVKHIWPVDTDQRLNAWQIVLESLALGARVERVKELARKWNCDHKDFVVYLSYNKTPSALQKTGAELFLEQVAGVDPDAFWDWLAATPKGKEPDFESFPVL